jgi:hypothetical protein
MIIYSGWRGLSWFFWGFKFENELVGGQGRRKGEGDLKFLWEIFGFCVNNKIFLGGLVSKKG